MARIKQFKLPDLGEGLAEGEILRWLVQPGDQIKLNQPIVEVETAKAAVEIPSPYAGVVTELFHGAGETVDVGAPIIAVDTEPGSAEPMSSAGNPLLHGLAEPPTGPSFGFDDPTPSGQGVTPAVEKERNAITTEPSPETLDSVEVAGDEGAVEPGVIGGPAPGGRTSVLVGYGPKTVTAARRPRKPTTEDVPIDEPPVPLLPTIPDALATGAKPVRHGGLEMGRAAERAAEAASSPVLAKPPVRKLAKDLGVVLGSVRGTGPGGIVTRVDVQRAAQHAGVPAEAVPQPEARPSLEQPTGAAAGQLVAAARETRRPIKGVRKLTAEAMVTSAFTAPHVTEFVSVDVTRSMRLVDRLKGRPEFAGVKVSPLLLVARALLIAARRHPDINASWDEAAGEIVVKHYVNLGIAAATPRGLMVPNIKSADRLSLPQLAAALQQLVQVAKEGKTSPADLTGGTITITNVGVFGVDTGTPILNPGEAAILCFGAVRQLPWVHKGKVKPRMVTQLALSFDHRLVDGELGSRFLADLAAMLEDPETLLVWS